MKKKIEFDCYDYFKGNFKRPEKLIKKDVFGVDALRSMQEAYNQMMYDAMVYGKGYALITKDIEPNKIQVSKVGNPNEFDINKRLYGHFKCFPDEVVDQECQHEPIDVGFNQTKMVCKKCDKEL